MNKVVIKIYLYALALSAVLSSCGSGGNEFSDVVEIADESDGSLPKATEVGNNTAGAYFEVREPRRSSRQVWTMNYQTQVGYQTAEIITMGRVLIIRISGHIKGSYSEIMPLQFTFSHLPVDSLADLSVLSNNSFRTSDGLSVAIAPSPIGWSSFTYGNQINVREATLSFTNCKQIYVDQLPYGVSVSGKFTMRGVAADTINITIDNGRFDLLFKTHDNGVFR